MTLTFLLNFWLKGIFLQSELEDLSKVGAQQELPCSKSAVLSHCIH